jgi:hypothetical protein
MAMKTTSKKEGIKRDEMRRILCYWGVELGILIFGSLFQLSVG